MYKRQAKKLSLKVWGYFKDHPEIKSKDELPEKLYLKILGLYNYCPLCELFYYKDDDAVICSKCPLGGGETNCYQIDGLYYKHSQAKTNKSRQKYATLIYDKINSWNIKKVNK
jgi:hypothetical protein